MFKKTYVIAHSRAYIVDANVLKSGVKVTGENLRTEGCTALKRVRVGTASKKLRVLD
jgi:hypothetical protein